MFRTGILSPMMAHKMVNAGLLMPIERKNRLSVKRERRITDPFRCY
jgi:hypothetical protein